MYNKIFITLLVCSSFAIACHGQNVISVPPIYDALTGQQKSYVEIRQRAYRSKERMGLQTETMYAIATSQSTENIKTLSIYYSSIQ